MPDISLKERASTLLIYFAFSIRFRPSDFLSELFIENVSWKLFLHKLFV